MHPLVSLVFESLSAGSRERYVLSEEGRGNIAGALSAYFPGAPRELRKAVQALIDVAYHLEGVLMCPSAAAELITIAETAIGPLSKAVPAEIDRLQAKARDFQRFGGEARRPRPAQQARTAATTSLLARSPQRA